MKNIFWCRRLTHRMKETYLQCPRNGFRRGIKSRNTRTQADARRISNICSRTCERLRENLCDLFRPGQSDARLLSLMVPLRAQLRN